ncbi:MAG: hypothetical protein P8099_04085 [Gemmatimonadota bacterium]|jgi:hypothetical protein
MSRPSIPSTRPTMLALVTVAAMSAGGCGKPSAGGGGWVVTRDTVGDTIVVHTLSGSVWGAPRRLVQEQSIGVFDGPDEYMFGGISGLAVDGDGNMYVYDRQVPVLRKYAPDGSFLMNLGRKGGGPGEYKNSDGGMAVLPDGRLALRDPGNARIQLYTPGGEPAGSWRIRGGFFTGQRMVVDSTGGIYTDVLLDPKADVSDWRMGLVRYADGEPGDTFPAPHYDYDAPRIEARVNNHDGTSVSINNVPYSPHPFHAFSPLGYWVSGVSTDYVIDLLEPGGVVRIRKDWQPVAVTSGEKDNAEARATYNMRQMKPDWKWNGPAIPDTKPPISGVLVGADGRIWVQVPQPGVEIPGVPEVKAGEEPLQRWREPVAFDVFEPDGTYLGRVNAPDGFRRYPNPIFRDDHVWAITRDSLDVEYVVRFRLSAPLAPKG